MLQIYSGKSDREQRIFESSFHPSLIGWSFTPVLSWATGQLYRYGIIIIIIIIIIITVIVNLRGKLSPGPGFEPGSPALRAGTLTN